MKYLLITITLLSIVLSAHAELTQDDLNKIRLIVKDEVDTAINASETRMKEYVDTKIDAVDKQFESVNKQISLIIYLVVALIALIVLGIGIPQLIIARRSKTERDQDKINQELREEIEILKNQRIQAP